MNDGFQAVVWDLDGTLIDSAGDLAAVLNELLGEEGLPALSVAQVKMMIGGGVTRLVERGWAASGRHLEGSRLEAMSARFLQLYASCASDRTRLFSGVEEVLAELRSRRLRQAVCTNKPRTISLSILRDLGVSDYFDIVIGGDSTAAKKPDPLPLVACLDGLGVDKSAALMVGDSSADVSAAQAAGLPVVLLRQGYSREPVDDLGADAVVDSVADLVPALTSLRRAA